MPQPLRIIMLGTGDFALPTFVHLCATEHNVIALITQPDRPQGRKQQIIPSPIALAAQERGIPVLQPENVNAPEFLEPLKALAPDLLITAAYGQILSAELLAIPSLGGINLHGSILPAYRGASPVARAIEHGDLEAGVTVIRMTPKIDAGGMIAVAKTPIDPNETAGALEERLAKLGAPLIAQSIAAVEAGTATILPQDKSKVTKAPKLKKDDGLIDWSKSGLAIHNLVRAMQPWPIASTFWNRAYDPTREPLRLIVHETEPVARDGLPGVVLEAFGDQLVVAGGQGAVRLITVQVPGKKPAPVAAFLNGNCVVPGERLG
ncbi:methionyl-tRNA formyltransferase [Singulisphaera sp. GP187]|uniref:methionyl-tRNA formyltransferase n=1 Tax=Singulisphaera sp. GP187 TaxID=1882752 RepID=UPI00092A9A41|nr:methionyl-tRNA formyltransferase [Singulisphaera sp. GP187]SIN98725.1 methionyl-tRNA formyltransferase [Singulisphaera sp. GP187]